MEGAIDVKPAKKASEMSVKELAAYIDQSVLKPEFTQEDICLLYTSRCV